jgi:2-oxoglutarate ferredoxin oxidoreductase subunit alpha
MPKNDVSIIIGGAAGDGSGSANSILLRSCTRQGLQVFASYNYQSAIRGGHIYWKSRIAEVKPLSQGDVLDVLVALNQESVFIHGPRVEATGGVLFNADKVRIPSGTLRAGARAFGLPVGDLTNPFGRLPIMQNTVALGAVIWLLQLDIEPVLEMVRQQWAGKDKTVQENNVGVVRAGYEYAKANFQALDVRLKGDGKDRYFLQGNQAFGAGLIAGGCKFYSAYPMTPASSILHYLVEHGGKFGVLAKQAEDEIAVINMAIGAAHMGVRAACATSGGGFSLMVEAMGLAGMIEEPLVVINVQRGGPSTGLPTKTEQGDLFLALGAGQGDFPRCIIAPLTIEDCCLQAQRALNLAERFQNPITILSDLYLSEHFETVDAVDLDSIKIDRGKLLAPDGGNGKADGGGYLRYRFTEDGVSPRAIPGMPGRMFVAASDEHDEAGHVISDVLCGLPDSIKIRRQMMDKRMRKLEGLRREMGMPVEVGPKDSELTLVGWGSTHRLLIEVAERLTAGGIKTDVLSFRDLYPMRGEEVAAVLRSRKRLLLVENNYTAQFGRLLRAETGVHITDTCLKFDGEPFDPHEIETRAKEVVKHAAAAR